VPIYEYACKKCGKVVEVFQKASDPGPRTCEKCGGRLGRVISHTSFQLKGGGWYKDLYSSTKPESGGEGGEPKAETKGDAPAAKSEARNDAKPEAKAEGKAETKSETKPAKIDAKKPAKDNKLKAV
jgi:putative FmdB family regulatory protein